MLITEYTVKEIKGMQPDGKTPYQYFVVQLGDNTYYKGHDSESGIKTTKDIGWASHVANEKFALELIGFLQNFYDNEGNIRKENKDKTIPPLVGVAESAEMLKWKKQQVGEYIKRGKFPDPLQRLASGPIWTYKQIEDYIEKRKKGNKD